MKMERRSLTTPLEMRAEADKRTIVGYAAVFNSPADIGGQFREQIQPGAFSGTVGGDIRALFGHDAKSVLGRTKSGTLRLREDEYGLAVEIDLPDTQLARDLRESMARGDIDGMSFGFNVPDGGDDWNFDGEVPVRTLRQVNLSEVSVVAFPAYEDTAVAIRSLDRERSEREKAEHNAAAARARIAARKAASEQKFRGIK
jgi:HK97 family phage prohead protease